VSINDVDNIFMLICNVSFTFPETMVMTIHNLCRDIKLVSPVRFCNRGRYYKYSVKRTNTGIMLKTGFRFALNQDVLTGILMYKMKMKRNTRSNRRSNIDKAIEEESGMMRLLVTWKIEHFGQLKVNVMPVEYDDELVLNEDKSAQLYEKVNDIPTNYYRNTWLMHDNTVLAVAHEAMWKNDLELNIAVSKGVKDEHTSQPMWIDPKR
jgi:hypothetical protein